MTVGHFFFLAVPFSVDECESLDLDSLGFASLVFDSPDFESLVFTSAVFASLGFSADFAALPSPEPSPDGAPELLPL